MSTHGAKRKQDSDAHPPKSGRKAGLLLKEVTDSALIEQTQAEGKKRDSDLFHQKKRAEKIEFYKKLFASVFPNSDWNYSHHGKHFEYKHKETGEVVHIEAKKGEIAFYGAPIEKIIEAARKYEQESGKTVEYEVEAEDLASAVEFMTELHQKGFDISKIKHILTKDNKEHDIKQIIADIKQKHPQKPSGPRLGAQQLERE